MRFSSLLAVSLLLAACSEDASSPGAGSTSDEPGSTGTAADASTGAASSSTSQAGTSSTGAAAESSSTGPDALEPIALDRAWVDSVAGPWLGSVSGTPIGDLPQFFLDFAWTDEDVLMAVADNGEGFRLEFSFSEQDGAWVFTELGELPGGFVQTQDLRPVEREGDRVRFEVIDRPGYLSVEIEPTSTDFEMAVQVRGNDHGTFTLARPG